MIATPCHSWLLHLTLALAAMVGALRAGTSLGDRIAPPIRLASAGRITLSGAYQALAANHGAPMADAPTDRASTRLAPTTRTAWQRGSRRTQRTASSQLADAERAPGTAFGTTPSRRIGAPFASQFDRARRDGRLRAAPTRAPPNVC